MNAADRATMLRRMQIAGYHDNRAVLDGAGLDAADAFELGARARAIGLPCGCIDCRVAAIARRLTHEKDPTMGLTDYRRMIGDLADPASNLSLAARAAGLELVARRIDGAVWSVDLHAVARGLAAEARAAMPQGVDLLTGLVELAAAAKLAVAS
jgi:hypothetical protein